MKIKLELELKPFSIPNYVIPITKPKPREEGFQENAGIPLSEISDIDLYKMCEEFKVGVFKKAGKARLPEAG